VGAALAVAALVTVVGVLRGGDLWLMAETGIALAIAAVPEGLPVVATITLALGMRRMAARKALVRSLPAVEALGSTTVICSDKTGTLTGGQMTATVLEVGGRRLTISGGAEALEGQILLDDQPISVSDAPGLELALRISALANRARIVEGTRVEGDPTEGALLVLARKLGLGRDALIAEHPEIGEIPFTSERKLMATFHGKPDGGRVAFVKGAPDRVTELSTQRLGAEGTSSLGPADRSALLNRNRELGAEGLRVLALAHRDLPAEVETTDKALSDLTFVGLVGIEDPPAPGVEETIRTFDAAGIRTVMITGDQAVTAKAIGERLGIGGPEAETLEGSKLARMDDEELARTVERTAIFSRIAPADKLRIVEAFQRRGDVVAMLGDGVNDAPALKRANIGVAMGRRGTDVAKETAGVVLQDDRFETIGIAVKEGRVVFDNVRKFVFYLFSCNLSEVLVILFATLAGLPMPLLPLQILWLNLVTDVFPALALAVEPAEDDVMNRPPRPPDAAILSRSFLVTIVLYALGITGATLAAYVFVLGGDQVAESATTVAFMTIALAQLFHVFNARSATPVVFSRRLFWNRWVWLAIALTVGLQLTALYLPPLARALGTGPLSMGQWLIVGVAATAPTFIAQVVKRVGLFTRRPGAPAAAAGS
jgi:Ca2+-transporting ATPase